MKSEQTFSTQLYMCMYRQMKSAEKLDSFNSFMSIFLYCVHRAIARTQKQHFHDYQLSLHG